VVPVTAHRLTRPSRPGMLVRLEGGLQVTITGGINTVSVATTSRDAPVWIAQNYVVTPAIGSRNGDQRPRAWFRTEPRRRP